MKNRIIRLFLTAILCLSLCPAVFAAESFQDVTPGAWYYDNVTRAVELGLMNGKGNGNFKPNDRMTEAESLTLAVRLHRSLNKAAAPLPEQQEGEPWYGPYYRYAVDASMLGDCSGGPEFFQSAATRRSYVQLFRRALPKDALYPMNSVPADAIPDVSMDDDGAEAIYAFYRAGILTGSDAHGYFNPDSCISRAEVAAILVRIMDENARKSFTLKAPSSGAAAFAGACAANGDACAVAFLGDEYDEETVFESYRSEFDFLDEAHTVESLGSEYYLIIPPCPTASVFVTEWIIDNDHIEGMPGGFLGSGEHGQPVIIRCNVSDIMPNVRVFIVDSEGDTMLEFCPGISLMDGKLQRIEGVYDITRYGEG